MDRVETKYEYARFVLAILDFFGTLILAVGAIWFVLGLVPLLGHFGDENGAGFVALLVLAPSFGAMVAGFLIVANGQLVRASLDNADCTREMLMLAREK